VTTTTLPSPSVLQHMKKKKARSSPSTLEEEKEEEGNGSFATIAFFATL